MSRTRIGNSLLLLLLAGAALALARWQTAPWWQGAPGSTRVLLALLVALAFGGVCVLCLRRPRIATDTDSGILLLWGSQTGFAMQLAEQGAAALKQAGLAAHAMPLEAADAALLRAHRRVLLIASTTGEGDCPDHAAGFLPGLQNQTLAGVEYAVLALGDSRYQQFCAYGKQLDEAMRAAGASVLFARIEVDAGNPKALAAWQHQLSCLAGDAELAAPLLPEYQAWRLQARHCLNPGSVGDAAWQISLTREAMHWQAGDVAVIAPRNAPERVRTWLAATGLMADAAQQAALAAARLPDPQQVVGQNLEEIIAQLVPLPMREYSIASIPAEGELRLLVRQTFDQQGQLGLGSGWLSTYAEVGSDIWLRVRSNPAFHAPGADTPMILIGSGTGIAGLRAHLAARAELGAHRNWLLFGEREKAHDFHFRAELEHWQQAGIITHLDTAFSRDSATRRYVQHVLAEQAERLREWVAQGAVIYVCGSLERMAPAVDAVILQTLGKPLHDQLQAEGRYRREVY
ncbi:sulfite reductase subunit alpha [Lysobacteraceae bacterium NML120232]|nr:sulfite reductase subunit alpha [Xanthomonadaceae bacterium NML120232]